ncbi:MAG: response regulator [Candidatus Margulisiibacteriota bacterium]|nr:response regulator [Candidatus Margulisiibacteriota bacterium]
MMKKLILLVEDDHKSEAAVKDIIGRDYNLKLVKDKEGAADFLSSHVPDLILIDFDLKKKDGLQVYRELRPNFKVIMLSASGNIPLAVTATKQGIVDFLRKPINADELREAIERNIEEHEKRLYFVKDAGWLKGESAGIKDALKGIADVVRGKKDVVLVGERGVPLEAVAEFIHFNGANNRKKLLTLNLVSYASENLESHFWTSLKAILEIPDANSLRREADLCGTLYLENLDSLGASFKESVLGYFKKAKKDVQLIFGSASKVNGYSNIKIPGIAERKEDLPSLLEYFLGKISIKYNKMVRFISSDLLKYLAGYAFPGNYVELEKMIEEAVLAAKDVNIGPKNFPLSNNGLIESSLKRSLNEQLTLEEARRGYEKCLFGVLMQKTGGEEGAVARFIDLPRSRVKDLID